MKRTFASVLLVLGFVAVPAGTAAQDAASYYCAPGQAPHYVFGFADLKSQIGDAMGEPVTCEFPDASGTGDVHQRTTTGLAFYRKSTNTPTFTNGFEHWGLTQGGLVYWTGDSIDPPGVVAPAPIIAPPLATPQATPTLPPVYSTVNGPRTEPQLRDELAQAGYAGPWDIASLLAAYGRATAPTPPPTRVPTSTPTSAPAPTPPPRLDPALIASCTSFALSTAADLNDFVEPGSDAAGRAAIAMRNECLRAAQTDGAAGAYCYQRAMLQWIRAEGWNSSSFALRDTFYSMCLGR